MVAAVLGIFTGVADSDLNDWSVIPIVKVTGVTVYLFKLAKPGGVSEEHAPELGDNVAVTWSVGPSVVVSPESVPRYILNRPGNVPEL